MSNPHAAAAEGAPMKTPAYAWPCLIVALFCAVVIVFTWQWLPGVTFPVFQGWAAANNPTYDSALMPNVMGLVPIAAMIMVFPTSYIVRRWGAKVGTIVGMSLATLGTIITALAVSSDFMIFLVGRFIIGFGLAATVISGPTCVSVWFPHATRGRGMAIWSIWAPIGIFTINAVGSQLFVLVGENMTTLLWVFVGALVVMLALFVLVFRYPRTEEASEVSAERKSFKEVLPLFKQRQLWCLVIMFAIFNYMNYGFSQYLKGWLTLSERAGGLGWDPAMAGIIGGLIVACGVLAPLGGFILDKTPKHLKYICVVAGITGLTLCSAFAFRNGQVLFAGYVLFFAVGNMFLNGCCRPMVPTYVFKGGATAVALGLSFLTLGQYFGQIFTSYALHPFLETTLLGQTDPMLAFWALVPVGVVGIILSFMMKPGKKEALAMKAGGGPGGGKPGGAPGGASGAAPEGGKKG
ncbi:MAG: MFS transporter [Coriobacteriales bacterium]|nr:MFS transporter [Coriobacteriales bacterium]